MSICKIEKNNFIFKYIKRKKRMKIREKCEEKIKEKYGENINSIEKKIEEFL